MKVHEYQARQLLIGYQIPVSGAEVLFNAKDTAPVFNRIAKPDCVAKVQVLMGGRGKAGGVKKIATVSEAANFVETFLGKPFSTYQSGGEAKPVKAILFAETVSVREEYYLGIVIDRSKSEPVILFSKEGGVDIEETAIKNPDAIKKIYFSPNALPSQEEVSRIISECFSDAKIIQQISGITAKLARLFIEKDASIAEINPLVLTSKGDVLALDSKLVFDDNALFRHEELLVLKDPDEEDEREHMAKKFGLSYVSMSGSIGCLVNGAGLAMATMDMIKLAGGEPANFLDVGGGANADQVKEAFKIILSDERVQAILVNIFGGIMKCDVIADGIIQASREMKLQVPLIVRLEGTHVEEGRELLKRSNLKIISCANIKEAAETAVKEAKGYSASHVHTH